jgi:small-conductance mechanosensitive channel
MVNRYFYDAAILTALGFTLIHLKALGKAIMSQQAQIDALTTQVDKINTEVTTAAAALNARLADLQAQIDAGVPSEQLDLTALASAIQRVDDINADPVEPSDVPVDVPVDETGGAAPDEPA